MQASSGNSSTLSRLINSDQLLGMTLFIAVIAHALVIFGISFQSLTKRTAPQVLEITIAQHQSAQAPVQADFLAQSNQEASGSLDEKIEMSTTVKANFHDNLVREVQLQAVSVASAPPAPKRLLTTQGESTFKSFETLAREHKERLEQEIAEINNQRLQEIASLEAKLAEQKQIYAKRPRKRQLSAEATKESSNARYVNDFRRKIERMGNVYYPPAARARNIYGEVRLLVAIRSNGELEQVKILKSSGYGVLDEAALQSVRQAAPFQPFSAELRRDTDVLEIIRTWKFEKGSYYAE